MRTLQLGEIIHRLNVGCISHDSSVQFDFSGTVPTRMQLFDDYLTLGWQHPQRCPVRVAEFLSVLCEFEKHSTLPVWVADDRTIVSTLIDRVEIRMRTVILHTKYIPW